MPLFFFRIEPTLPKVPQEEQPGMVNWTILSVAQTSPEKENIKITAKNTTNVLFIIHLILIICLDNLKVPVCVFFDLLNGQIS
jgi:hypothetical protein